MDRAQVRDLANRDAGWPARRRGDCSERVAAGNLTSPVWQKQNEENTREPAKASVANHSGRKLPATRMAGRPRHVVKVGAAHAHARDVAAACGTPRGSAK